MERFRGILICTTNRLKDLDKASIRRFNTKLGFDYLRPEGNIIFYLLLLEPLCSTPVNSNTKKELKAIQNLTPGDFKIVRDRFIFYNKHEIDHTILIEALKEEVRIKNTHSVKNPIGF
jgi:hypothetical protein